jgi:hypothetical protein
MREHAALRRYHWELGGALALYTAVLFGSITVAESMSPGFPRTLLVVTPAIPIAILIWVIARHFRRVDEYVRLRTLEDIGIAAAVTAGWTLTYGFLEGVGFPRLTMFWVWPVMGAVWFSVTRIRAVLSR